MNNTITALNGEVLPLKDVREIIAISYVDGLFVCARVNGNEVRLKKCNTYLCASRYIRKLQAAVQRANTEASHE